MKRYDKITILILIYVTAFVSAGIITMEPRLVLGQLIRKSGISVESRRDPFFLPPGVRLLSKEIPVQENKKILQATEEVRPAEVPLKLKAILIGDHIRLVSIDRSIVSIGDFINGEKVLEIRSDRVILGKEGKKRTLVLDQSPVKLTVEER